MRPSLKSLRKRTADKARLAGERAREIASGSDVPAGQEPTAAPAVVRAGARERAAMRRRGRRLRRVREAMLRDLGVLVVELQRRGRVNPTLVRTRAEAISAVEDELRGLAAALEKSERLEQVVLAGIAASCEGCGAVLATDDRYCPSCGTPRSPKAPAPQPELAAAAEEKR